MAKKLIKTEDVDNRGKIEKFLHDNNITFSKYASSDGDEYYYFVNTVNPLEIEDVEYEILPVNTNMNLELAADEGNPMMQPEPDRIDTDDKVEEINYSNGLLISGIIVGVLFALTVVWAVFL